MTLWFIITPIEKTQLIDQTRSLSKSGSTIQWFYGWVMLPLAILLMVASSPGQTYGVTFFNKAIRNSLEISSTQLSATYMVATLAAAMLLPLIGGLADRHGMRRATISTILMLSLACVIASQIRGYATLLVAYLMLRAFGSGAMVLLATNTVAAWFDRRLGMAIGILQVVMAGAMALVPASIVILIESLGWRGAYVGIAAIMSCILLPLVFIAYRQSPGELGQLPDGLFVIDAVEEKPLSSKGLKLSEATRKPAYWILLVTTGIWGMINSGILFHLESIFLEQQLSTQDSITSLAYLALAMGLMQVLGAFLADRTSMRLLICIAMALFGVSCLVIASNTANGLAYGCIIFGLSQGLMTIIAGTVWARYFGRAHLGKIRGTSITMGVACSSLGPFLMGLSIDTYDAFTPALLLFAILAIAISIAAYWARSPISMADGCCGVVIN